MAKATAQNTPVYYATGRRKTSAARVYLKPGKGHVIVNSIPVDKYLASKTVIAKALAPFAVTETKELFDATIQVTGGGKSGQAGAIAHGITRALMVVDAAKYRGTLKKAGMVTRDDRMVERKKYGKHGARRSTQWVKR